MSYLVLTDHPLNSELLQMIKDDNLLMLSEPDFLNALKHGGEVYSLKFATHELESQRCLDDNLKDEIIHAKTIFIIIETLEDESIKKYSHTMDYIYSVVDDDVTVLIDTKIVKNISDEPVTILLFG